MKNQTYTEFVTQQCPRNPCLEDLRRFLQRISFKQPCRACCLELDEVDDTLARKEFDTESLTDLLGTSRTEKPKSRILVVEDLTKEAIELLGPSLDIDPLFFASHIDGTKVEVNHSLPPMVRLPSQVKRGNFFTLRYHRVLTFGAEAAGLRRLESTGNVPRKVMILPSLTNSYIGLAQRCCSILLTDNKQGGWTALILVDPPLNTTYRSSNMEVTLQPSLFQGGYEDILGPGSYVKNETQYPERLSLLEDIVFYWTRKRPPTFDARNPTLLSLMYYPLKIVAAEWVVYLELFNRIIRQYEYSTEALMESHSLTKLDSDLRAMQAWIRRCTQTGVKLQFAVMFIQSRSVSEAEKQAYELLSEDYQHLAAMIRRYSDLLETKIQVATSMVQIADSRRSLNEARNVTRLTNLALLFIPMSFITGLLSMNDQISTKGLVWFFSLAIPGCAAVFLVARLPEIRISRVAEKLRGLKRVSQVKV